MWEIFEALCKERGMTTADVSRATGIGQPTFANWKKRRSIISTEYGLKIANVLGVSIEYLMTGTEREGYYENDETAAIAQEIHDNRELRGLFSAVKGADPKMIEALHKMFIIMKNAERNERSED